MGADVDTLAAASHVTVVDAPTANGAKKWRLLHFDHARRSGWELVRREDLMARLAELEEEGRVIGLAWEMRYRPVPLGWPGQPTTTQTPEEDPR